VDTPFPNLASAVFKKLQQYNHYAWSAPLFPNFPYYLLTISWFNQMHLLLNIFVAYWNTTLSGRGVFTY